MADTPSLRNRAFVSYSHADKKHLARLRIHLAHYTRELKVDVWDDTRITPGMQWKKEIKDAIASAKVAILLVSADFLASEFIARNELPPLLEAAKNEGARIFIVILSPCAFKSSSLAQYQTLNAPSDPLITMLPGKREATWAKLAEEVAQALAPTRSKARPSQPPRATHKLPEKQRVPVSKNKATTQKAAAPSSAPPKARTKAAALPKGDQPNRKKSASSRSNLPRMPRSGAPVVRKKSAPPLGTILLTYEGHSGAVYTLAWSPNGKRLASGSADQTVRVWDATTGKHILTYTGHSKQINSVVWSPDSMRLASGSGGVFTDERVVQVWDPITSHCLLAYTSQGSLNSVYALAWSPDSMRLVSGGYDKRIQVWSATTDKRLLTCEGHTDWVRSVAWSPDSKRLASGGEDNTVRVWSATSGKHIFTCEGHSNYVRTVAWSPDGTRLASGSLDKTVQVWDATTRDRLFTCEGHSNHVYAVAWSPNGTRLASASGDKTVKVWDAATGKCLFTYKGHAGAVYAVAWSFDGRCIASASDDKTVQVWSAG